MKDIKIMINEINSTISTADQYLKIHKRISEEIDNHREDGLSLYSRRHLNILREHFRPDTRFTKINPYNFEIYLETCKNKGSQIIKLKYEDLKSKIEELHRVFNAVMKDELLIL